MVEVRMKKGQGKKFSIFTLHPKRAQKKEINYLQLTFLDKKAQMKIQQMAFMLIAVFMLFVLIGMIILSSRVSNIRESGEEFEERNALTLASKLANSPEFSCEESYGTQKSNCIDLDKVMSLKENLGDYLRFWGVSNIEIRKSYPSDFERECDFENYPDCNYVNLIGSDEVSGYSVSNFVSVCYKEAKGSIPFNKCEIGRVIISYETDD